MAKMVYDPTIGHGEVVDEPTKGGQTHAYNPNYQVINDNGTERVVPRQGTGIIDDPKPSTQQSLVGTDVGRRERNITGVAEPVKGEIVSTNPAGNQRGVTSIPLRQNPEATPNDSGSGNGGGGAPSGGGGYGGGTPSGGGGTPAGGTTPSLTEEQLAEINAIEGKNIEPTDYLLNEYNNMDAYKQEQQDLINNTTQQLIDLANQQIDEQLKVTLSDYANQLDQAKQQFSIARAKMEQMKATEADNLALAAQAKGDYGGVSRAQYSAQMQQRDQALYEIDLAQINLEQQINQAITEAKATGNYTKLAHQIELATAQYENLLALASEVENIKTSDATRLDQYYLQVQQLQQESVLNKINYGMTVTAEDMAMFGLSGMEAKNAADAINASQGVERQMLTEQLKSMQRANTAATYSGGGGGGYYGGGGGGGSTGGGEGSSAASPFLNDSQMSEIERRIGNRSLYLYNSDGTPTGRVFNGSTMNPGEYFALSDGTRVYMGRDGQLTSQADYTQQENIRQSDNSSAQADWRASASSLGLSGSDQSIYNSAKSEMDRILNAKKTEIYLNAIRSGVANPNVTNAMAMQQLSGSDRTRYAALQTLVANYDNKNW